MMRTSMNSTVTLNIDMLRVLPLNTASGVGEKRMLRRALPGFMSRQATS
jgi:hypothetical protein